MKPSARLQRSQVAIFISYSQKDKAFADKLAMNLVKKKHHVWMDRWELNVGDSLVEKVQSALTDSSAVLVLLSKNSVSSEWCKKELNVGLVRELGERQTLLMPCLIEDCDIPLFLRDKLYADFRTNPDEALKQVENALDRISNPQQSRIESPGFDTDWAVDWKTFGAQWIFEWVFVDHGQKWPYVVMSKCSLACNDKASKAYAKLGENERMNFMRDAFALVVDSIGEGGLSVIITSPFEKFIRRTVTGKRGQEFSVVISYRRLGVDNGMDTIYHIDNNLRMALKHMTDVMTRPSNDQPRSV